MEGQILKIIFKDNLAYLTEEIALDFKQVAVSPHSIDLISPAYWTVKVIRYIELENKLFVDVISCDFGEAQFSAQQIAMADLLVSIEKVDFKSVPTDVLLKTFKNIAPTGEPITWQRQSTEQEPEIKREPIKRVYNESFDILLKNVTFLDGLVTFEKKIQKLNKSVKFTIYNESIIKEYDAIKNYFGKVMNAKRIQVDGIITTLDNEISKTSADSPEIGMINKKLIEEVKYEFVKGEMGSQSADGNELVSVDEFLNQLNAQSLFGDDQDFFENMILQSKTKHHHHLGYLSSKHRADLHKLYFVPRPFSFVFLLSGKDNFYIVWETLDTQEATYIWSIPNDHNNLQQELTDTYRNINLVIKDGRNEYRSLEKKNFTRVFHDYKDLQNGFKSWKEEVDNAIE